MLYYNSREALAAATALTIFVITALVAGFKLAFRGSRWTESIVTVTGGFLLGDASGIAVLLLP